MSAYMIVRVQISDAARYAEYIKAAPAIVAQFGGRYIARGGECVTLEGPQETARVVIIEFPTLAAAKDFYQSEQYRQTRILREGAATAQFLAVDGVPAT